MVAAAALVLVAMVGYGQSESVVTVAATRSTAIAALDTVSFKLTRAGATASALTVTVDLSQTREYLTSTDSQTVTFSADSSTANLFFGTSRFSSTVSGSGTLTATVAAGTGYAVGEPGAASVSMSAVSGTAVAVKLSAASYSFSEGAAAADRSVTVVAEMAAGLPAPATAIGVTLRSSEVSGDGAATSGTDFTALSEQVSIAPSAFSAQNGRQVARVTQALAITDDTEVEEDESLTVALRATPATPGKVGFSNPDGTACSGFTGTCTATVTIADNDVAPVLALAVSPANINETGATTKSTITVSSSNAATFEVDQTIGLSFAGTAAKDTDYTVANETLTLEAGDASVATTVTALSDSVDDGGETIIVTATHGSSTIGTKTITIDRPAVTLALSTASITEDGGTSQVTATVVPASPTAFTVALTTEPGSGTDFSLSSPATLSFAPAAGASSNTVTITAADNDVDAANKTVTITGSVSIQGVGAPVARTLTIADDDVRGVSVSASSLTVAEGGSEDYTVVLDSEPTEAVTVGVARSSGSDSDVSVSPSTLAFSAADWSVAQPVTVSAQSDADTSNDSATIEHTVTGGDYGANSVTAASVAVTVPDSEAPPGQVTGLILTPGVGRLAVSWNAVTNADGYRVQWKSGSQSYNTSDRQRTITSGTTTSYTITGLTADTEYSVRVTATRTDAADGTPASATATPRAPAPGQVTGVTLTAGVGQVAVSWNAVTDADGYKVQWKSGDQSYNTSDRQHPITSGTTTSYTITGLTAGTAYKVQVRATRANAADGEPSAPQTATAQFAAPAQVTGVTLTAGIGQVTVSWSAVTDANGYKVQWKSGDQSYNTSDRQHPITSGTTTSYAITSLTAGTAYTVQVRATRANAADGEPSAPQTATARAAAPAKVTNVVATPKVEALTISWTAVTNANGYKVQWKSGEEMYDETDRQRTVSSGFTTTDTIPGLDPAKTYTVQVIATRQHATDGPASDPATGRPRAAAAAQVTGVRLTVGIRQLDVSWTAVTNADGYKVQWKSGIQSYGATRQRTVVGGSTTSDTIPGLTPGTEYSVQVIAIRDNADDGQPSSGAKATPRTEAPGQVTGVSVTTEVRGLAVTWTAATNADGYRVQWKSGAQTYNETDRQHVITDAATSYTIPSLDPDTNYTIRVTATRLHADDGRPSAEQTGRPLTTPPAKVTGLVLTREVRALGVTWSTATDADGYKVQWKSGEETYNETDRQRTVSDGATTSDTIPGLTPGTPYTVQVIATRDNAPDGMSSDQQTAIPKAEPPAQVTGVRRDAPGGGAGGDLERCDRR